MTNNNLYIPSIEASKVHEHEVRGKGVYFDFTGMIPDSLELRKLRQQPEFENHHSSHSTKKKEMNTAIINVKFETKVKSGAYILESVPVRLKEIRTQLKDSRKLIKESEKLLKVKPNSKKLSDDIEKMKKEHSKSKNKFRYYVGLGKEIKANGDKPKWAEVSADDLRIKLYTDGFTIKLVDYETGDITDTTYKFYKRSSSKSRKGEAWFICEELYDVMIKWSRMNIPFVEGQSVDLAGLMAYESLVTSSIVGTVKIDPKSILMISEMTSTFKETVNVVYKKGEILDSKEVEDFTIENSIHDGEALLDSSLFEGQFEGKGFILLRSHMFKAAGFNTNLVQFYKDYYGDDYETATVEDMFGNVVKISDVRMLINPTCLKALKFSNVINNSENKKVSQNAMWKHWLQQLSNENGIMGVCKYEKETKRGELNGKPLQRTSYQMLNSLVNAKPDDIQALVDVVETKYIDNLKNDDKSFIDYLKENANLLNSNNMFVDLYNQNNEIVRTKMFRTFRTKTITKYIDYMKKGKVRLVGDYVIMLSCGVQYLYHSVNAELGDTVVLKGNEIHTTLFGEEGYNKEYVAFRNPHSSASNIYKCFNVKNKLIEQYFNLTPNIVVVNSVDENIMNRLNGCDFDSDSIVIFDNKDMLNLVKESYDQYKVCVNNIDSDPTKYTLKNAESAKLDNILSGSTSEIGFGTNVGQLALSLVSDKLKYGKTLQDNDVKELLTKVEVLTVLAGISIDSAKRQYAIEANKQILRINRELNLNEIDVPNATKEIQKYIKAALKEDKNQKFYGKPKFWKFVQNDKHTKNQKDEEENVDEQEVNNEQKEGNEKKKLKKPLMTTHYNCPMDYLFDVKFDRATGKDPLELIELVESKNKRDANRKQKTQLDDLATDAQNQIAHTLLVGGDEEEVNVKLEDVMEGFNQKFSKFKVSENTLYAILFEINEETEKGKKKDDQNNNCVRLMNHLYNSHKTLFLNAFKLGK